MTLDEIIESTIAKSDTGCAAEIAKDVALDWAAEIFKAMSESEHDISFDCNNASFFAYEIKCSELPDANTWRHTKDFYKHLNIGEG